MSKEAWFCPSCQKHHAPHVDTCPGDSGFKMPAGAIPISSPLGLDTTPKCHQCGLRLDSTMAYCCPDIKCPTGLGPTVCTNTILVGLEH